MHPDTLPSPAGPLNLSSFDWPTVVAVAVVAATVLALDFASFRAAEIKRLNSNNNGSNHQESAAPQEEQEQQQQQQQQSAANGAGGGGGKDAVQVSVRPGRSSASSGAEESLVHRNRACVLAGWIVGALVFHRLVRLGMNGLNVQP